MISKKDITIILTIMIMNLCLNTPVFSQSVSSRASFVKAKQFERVNTDSALIHIEAAFLAAQKSKNESWKAEVSQEKSKIHLSRGEVDLAVEYGLMARNAYSKLGSTSQKAKANLILAQAYCSSKQPKKSEECLKLAEKLAKKNKLASILIEITICRGNNCFRAGDHDGGMAYYLKAEKDAKGIKDLYLKTKIQNNIANILVNIGKPDEALPRYKLAVSNYHILKKPLDELLVLYNIGRLYRSKGEVDSSLFYCNLCLDLGKKVHSLEDITYAYSALSETYKVQGDFEKALEYSDLMHIYKDSLEMNANQAQIVRLESDFELTRNRDIIQRQNRNLKRSSRFSTLVIIALNITVALIVLGTFYYRKSRRLNKALQRSNEEIREQNKTIDQALSEKEILLKEVHHRVKNSLQIISSLLNLQESQLTDEIAIEALRNSKTRIQTIALMHQSLYQRGADLGKVKSSNYLKNILSLQLEALSSENKHPKTLVDVVEQELSMDQAVPLGLIASEIINNAIKHAYSDTVVTPELQLQSRVIDNKFELIISDNGQGFESSDFRNHSSLGLEIVEALNNQLHGEMTCVSSEKGTVFTFLFPIE